MAATYLGAGSFTTNLSSLPVSASLSLPANTNVVVMWAQALLDDRQSLGTPTLGGVTASLSYASGGSGPAMHRMLVFEFSSPVSGAQTLQAQLPSYGNCVGVWAAFNSDSTGSRFDAGSSFTTQFDSTTAPTTNARTVPDGGILAAGAYHAFVGSGVMTTTSGTSAQSVKVLDMGIAAAYRATTGALAWSAGSSERASTTGVVILGAGAGGSGGTAPTVTAQPNNATVTAGATATFAAVFGNSPTGFQWQRSTDGGTSWSNIAGATSASYTTPVTAVTGGAANNNDRYRCTATNTSGSVTTNAAVLTVNAAGALTITSEPLRDQSGALLANTTIFRAYAVLLSDVSTVVAVWNSPATNASGVLQLANAALTSAPTILTTVGSGGTAAGAKVYVPA